MIKVRRYGLTLIKHEHSPIGEEGSDVHLCDECAEDHGIVFDIYRRPINEGEYDGCGLEHLTDEATGKQCEECGEFDGDLEDDEEYVF